MILLIILIVIILSYLIYIVFINIPKPFNDLTGAAYLSPWYFENNSPGIIKKLQQLKWRFIEEIGGEYAGVMVLEDKDQNCFAVLKTYSYILPFANSTKFLAWNRKLDKNIPQKIRIFQYDSDDLKINENPQKKIQELNRQEATFWIEAAPASILEFKIDPRKGIQQVEFPQNFKLLDEFIIIEEIEDIYENPENRWNNTALIICNPKQEQICVYPQDWFNKSNYDFGYQWITRAGRDPKTGYVRGQGIRIDDFILDKTNRQRKYLKFV